MPEIYSLSSENEVADFIKNCNSEEVPIEITGHNSKSIGRLIQCSKSLHLKNLSGIIIALSNCIGIIATGRIYTQYIIPGLYIFFNVVKLIDSVVSPRTLHS